ncbi:ABC transporter ATP-binding protein [Candidatus Riesia sp. GBBU]|nr:ABC transporter ATP-binding protein [Candidatus Riesia sp. GBBU]
MLEIKNLVVNVKNKRILDGINLKIEHGEIHAIMGQNGSGKTTLSSVLAGDKRYKVISGKISFANEDVISLVPEDRARKGIFLSFQNPTEIPGVSNQEFLRESINSIRKYRKQKQMDMFEFREFIKNKIKLLNISKEFLKRSVNTEMSGGEKKKSEVLQMISLNPKLSILDEIDSGLDIDSMQIVSKIINSMKEEMKSFLIITHYQKFLDKVKPDFVHILNDGKIVKSGGFSLSKKIDKEGYEKFT